MKNVVGILLVDLLAGLSNAQQKNTQNRGSERRNFVLLLAEVLHAYYLPRNHNT